VDNLGDIVDNIVVPAVENAIQLYHLVVDLLDPGYQVFHILIKFLLELFGPERLMDVRL